MEARHFVAGPWFTVQPTGTDWHRVDSIWWSDGDSEQVRVHVEMYLQLEEIDDED